jgi:hypothetical protein
MRQASRAADVGTERWRTLMVGREAMAKIVPLRTRRRERAQAQQDYDRGRFNARSIDRDSFFVRQDRMLDPLLAWGVGNVVGGGVLAAVRGGALRSIGLQAMLWGSIDTTFAVRWQLAARRNALAARSGELSADAIHDEAIWFERVQALNTGLGALYITAGAVLAVKGGSVRVRGVGAGVMIQGGALLAYDLGLTIWTVLRPETRFAR